MSNFIDIHSHILPGVDDGAQNLSETLDMIRNLKKLGFQASFCTSHQKEGSLNPTLETLKNVYNSVKEEIKDYKLFLGAENYYDPQFAERISTQTIPTLGNSEYVLFEFNPLMPPLNFENVIFKLNAAGYTPILAHTERYEWLNLKTILKVKDSLLCQANINNFNKHAASRSIYKRALKYMEHGIYDFLATDLHYIQSFTYLEKSMSFIDKKFGRKILEQLLFENPSQILNSLS